MSDQDTTLLEPVDGGARSRTLMVLLGLLVVLALGAGAYWLLLGPGAGGDADQAAESPVAVAQPEADDHDTAVPSADAVAPIDEATVTALPTVTYEVFLARDPFDPVVPEDVEPASETSEAEDQDQTEPGDDDATTPTDEGCRGDSEVVCDGRVITVVGITTDDDGNRVAVVQVDTTVYEVKEGDRFATHFEVVEIEQAAVRFRFGDIAFRVSEGDSVLK